MGSTWKVAFWSEVLPFLFIRGWDTKLKTQHVCQMVSFDEVAIVNGFADIIAALAAIFYQDFARKWLHSSLFKDENRHLSYWVFTYGLIRISNASYCYKRCSYLFEFFAFANETEHGNIKRPYAIAFASVMCILMSCGRGKMDVRKFLCAK
jgi:hypothetical protein